ncbi:MAG: sterol desaturase family protein [Planctomycetota bacterium]
MLKPLATVLLFAFFGCWETLRPFLPMQTGRLLHAARNLAIAILNTLILSFSLGLLTVSAASWSERRSFGVLHQWPLPTWIRVAVAIVLLDGWMYLWHRANHQLPFLWRFHRMHHSDDAMDVTTATRFHLGEHLIGSTIRLGIILLAGLAILEVVIYETLVVAVTMFHHANISIGRWDPWARLLVVTPDMHKVHHSQIAVETNSNYSTLFSFWDRLACSLRTRGDTRDVRFGLREFAGPGWQSLRGMLLTPFATVPRDSTFDSSPGPTPPDSLIP